MSLSKQKEYLIRGRVVHIGANMEAMLLRLIVFGAFEEHGDGIEQTINFRGFTFNNKIASAKATIKKSHPDLLTKYPSAFKKLNKFGDFRSRIAHNMITWDEENLSYFYIWDIAEDKESVQFHQKNKVIIRDFLNELEKHRKNLTDFGSLCIDYEERFKKNYPDFYRLIEVPQEEDFDNLRQRIESVLKEMKKKGKYD